MSLRNCRGKEETGGAIGEVDWAKEAIWYEREMKYHFIHYVPVVKTVNLPLNLPLWFIASSWSHSTAIKQQITDQTCTSRARGCIKAVKCSFSRAPSASSLLFVIPTIPLIYFTNDFIARFFS